jgi:pimeloyl-ACP methyl ester carboxylesterase
VLDADPWHRSVFNHLVLHPDHFFGAWSRITAPTLWVTADESETRARFERAMGSQAEMHKRMQRLPRLRSHRLAQAGHNLQHDQPEALAAVIEAFLDEA